MSHDVGRYPDQDSAARVRREMLRGMAVEAYRVFYPSVSVYSFFVDNIAAGAVVNKEHFILSAGPQNNALTANSDTAYAPILLDVTDGPMVLELPAGPTMGLVDDLYFRLVANIGLPGPDRGEGGKHLFVGPGYEGDLPADGYFVHRAATNRLLSVVRAVPPPGHPEAGIDLLARVATYPLGQAGTWSSRMVDISGQAIDATSATRELTIEYWQLVHEIIASDVVVPEFRYEYGRLAALGIRRDAAFPTDSETLDLLVEAAAIAAEQMAVEAFLSERPDRLVWPDRAWEWPALYPDAGYEAPAFVDLQARDRWFYQATLSSNAMFARKAGFGSIYLAAYHDSAGAPLDGGQSYRLVLPAPLPAKQFWSVTVYNVRYRSEIVSPAGKAAISSLSDTIAPDESGAVVLYFGPEVPQGHEDAWIQTVPGEDWFPYLRLYGPEEAAFDGSWKPSDITRVE